MLLDVLRVRSPGVWFARGQILGLCFARSFGLGCNMCLPTSPGRVLPLLLFLSMASKLLRDQESLVSLLMAHMLSDVFGANVEGRVLGLCCKTYSQICRTCLGRMLKDVSWSHVVRHVLKSLYRLISVYCVQ